MKTVRVRFPSDDEWVGRQRRRKVLVKQLGRGISETTVANGEDVDAALVAKIRAGEDAGDRSLRGDEGRRAVEPGEVDDVVPDGDSFKVTLRVLGATTVHLLKMPSAKDVFEYRRGFARLLDMPFGRQEVTINIASAAALYKKLVTSTEGYVGEAPIIHQAVAVKAAIDAMDTAFAEDRERKFLAGEWPDDPSFRFLVHWALRRDELCDPGLCPDAPDDDGTVRPLPAGPAGCRPVRGEGTAYPARSRPDGRAQAGRSHRP